MKLYHSKTAGEDCRIERHILSGKLNRHLNEVDDAAN